VDTVSENSPFVAGAEDLAPGTFIGEYKIEAKLGQGGMGSVYAAHHPVIGKRVAVKVLSYFYSRDMILVRRFTDEARAVNKIGHPNIIDVFSFGQLADGRHYFVMELLEGETMAAWFDKGRPELALAKRLLLQVCEALEAAHREGIIHRDLKPDNIWIARPKHGEPFIKVLDFGIAKLVDSDEAKSATRTGTVMGTPQFMSPEQCVGRGVDHRTDIYAMGVILFRAYCGRLPFDGDSAAEIIAAQLYTPPSKPSPGLPEPLETLILDCLAKDPALRPATAAELGSRLQTAASVAGVATMLEAPEHTTGKGAAETRKGYASEEDAKEAGQGKGSWRWLPFLVAGGLLVAGGVVLFLSLRGGAPVQPASSSQPAGPKVAPSEPVRAVVPPAAAIQPATAPPAAVAPPSAVVEPALRRRAPSGKSRAETAPAAGAPGDGTPPASAEPRHKPSRAAREGLIQENPF
jgi:eukaryotic-like serine/threonine-protein kinase